MKAESKSVSFLKDVQTFEVPFFQRAYVWKKDNWEDLFDDLIRVDQRHFLGSLILKRIVSNSSVFGSTRVSVIDGQQRLTTISILIKAIWDSFDETTKKNTTNELLNLLFCKKKKTDSAYHIKLKHSKVDREDFEKVICSVSDEKILSIDPVELANLDYEDENSNHKILCCYKYFRDRLALCNTELTTNLFDSILDDENKMVVVIELDEQDHEQQIFDTINSAGVRLTSTDIVKNALFQKILEYNSDEEAVFEFYDKTWNKTFSSDDDNLTFWGRKKAVGRMMRDNSEVLLQAVAIITKIFDPNRHSLIDIPDLYKNHIKNMNESQVKDFIKTIIEYAQIYQDKVPDLNKMTQYDYENGVVRLFHILEVLGFSTFNPYILYLFKKYENDEKTLLLRLGELEKFIMRRQISNESPKNYNKDCIDFMLDEERAGRMARDVRDDAVFAGLSKMRNRDAALVLFWVELRRRSKSQKYDEKALLYNFTLEHIMPQKWKENWNEESVPYVTCNGNEITDSKAGESFRSQMIYSIGNMTLLNGKLNTSIKNNAFKVKMEGSAKRKGVLAYASLSITTDDIVDEIYKKDEPWNEQKIFERQKKLFDEIECIWGDGVPMGFVALSVPAAGLLATRGGKSAASTIKVFDENDSLIIHEGKASQSMVSALLKMGRKVGLEKIAKYTKEYKISLDKLPLVKYGKHDAENADSKVIEKGYYVNVHSSTSTKIGELERISKAFNLGWKFVKD